MSCCGHKRAQLSRSLAQPPAIDTSPSLDRPADVSRTLEYTGDSAVTLLGAITGRVYRFDHHGARVEVAYEDSHALLAEASLRRVRG